MGGLLDLLHDRPLEATALLLVSVAGWELYRFLSRISGILFGVALFLIFTLFASFDKLAAYYQIFLYLVLLAISLTIGWFIIMKLRKLTVLMVSSVLFFTLLSIYFIPVETLSMPDTIPLLDALKDTPWWRNLIISLVAALAAVRYEKTFVIILSSAFGALSFSLMTGEKKFFFLIFTAALAVQTIFDRFNPLDRSKYKGEDSKKTATY